MNAAVSDIIKPCYMLNDDVSMCLSDVEKLYQNRSGCVEEFVDEKYAFIQSFDITMMLVTSTVLMAKLCAVNYDSPDVNKLTCWKYVALLGWSLCGLVQVCGTFFVNPGHLFNQYIKPFENNPRMPRYEM